MLFALQFHVLFLCVLNILKGLYVARFVRFVLAISAYLTLLQVNIGKCMYIRLNSLTYLIANS